jgi:predicted phosphodiesterase
MRWKCSIQDQTVNQSTAGIGMTIFTIAGPGKFSALLSARKRCADRTGQEKIGQSGSLGPASPKTTIPLLRNTTLMLILMLVLASACATQPPDSLKAKVFQHDISTGPKPWTHENFDNDPDKFSFALISDLTGGEREGIFAVAVEQLRLLRPELIVSVGDLIEGGTTDLQQLEREWESFDQRAGRARAPVFRVGGNHDLTHPVMWDVWEERYGDRYYHFIYKNTLFLVLDTEDNTPEEQQRIFDIRNEAMKTIRAEGWGAFHKTEYASLELRKSGGISERQVDYFRNVIEQNPQVSWTFMLMHKPAWQRPEEENFSRIEAALEDRPYTVFYGHVHSYLHEQRHGRDYIRLGTTGGAQDPSKEMAIDHVTWVTMSGDGVDIANIRLSGIFNKTGKIPLNGEELCFESAVCGER